jgi:predicted amidohydrolase
MTKDLHITLVQNKINWESPLLNIKQYNKQLSALAKGSTDVIVLPEMFNTGFSMQPERCAEEMGGLSMQWMHETATSLNAAICGSLMMKHKKKFVNRMIWMQPNGNYFHYDKRHLFSMAGENKVYSAGKDRLIVEVKGWKVCPLICYDLRFPVWSRNEISKKEKVAFDVLIYSANWPAVRSFAWQQLLIARAIENQCYVAGVNRIGKDGNGFDYTGNSVLLDPLGKNLSSLPPKKAGLATITAFAKELTVLRSRFPVLKDADKFHL